MMCQTRSKSWSSIVQKQVERKRTTKRSDFCSDVDSWTTRDPCNRILPIRTVGRFVQSSQSLQSARIVILSRQTWRKSLRRIRSVSFRFSLRSQEERREDPSAEQAHDAPHERLRPSVGRTDSRFRFLFFLPNVGTSELLRCFEIRCSFQQASAQEQHRILRKERKKM